MTRRVLLSFLVVASCDGQAGGPSSPSTETARSTAKSSAGPREVAADEQLTLAPFQKSALTLVGTTDGKPAASTFERLTGRLTLHEGQPTALEFSVETASVVGSSDKLVARLKDKDTFDVKTHARVELHVKEIRPAAGATGGATHVLVGDLVVLGKATAVSVPVHIDVQGDAVTVTTQASIGRADWMKSLPAKSADAFGDHLQVVGKLVFPRTP